ncbi:DUF6461 domain-containing protein [Actinomadura sp. HBU206391]|uniref:DUF6461 domain-containing protein n=1 Tax=Actinomadura sp. HBU206391 TaxID=2731692 RepID=UPI001650C121|nr:DUF6461 domain-containing protein [Actinomadura sp. HBU206391]MBC6457296.1 hypothetical protein [Actinomadura sp. HBU206391]
MDGQLGEDAFGWIDATCLSEAACVTFTEDDEVGRVAAAFGGRLDHALPVEGVRPLAEALAVVAERIPGSRFGKGLPVALFARRDGWAVTFEDNGGEGTRAAVLERASRVCRSVSVFWNVNMLTKFAFAENGRVLAEFSDGALGSVHGADPGRIDAALEGLGWESRLGAMFTLAGRLTGQVFTPEWLNGEFLAVPLVRWPRRDADGRLFLPELDGALGEALRSAGEGPLRRAAFAAAEYAVTMAGISGHPVIAEALAAWPERPALLERMAQSVGSRPARSNPGPMRAQGRAGETAPAVRPADLEIARRLRGYPEGVSDSEPGHAMAVQALHQATEAAAPVVVAYRAIKYADEARRDLGHDVAGLREVVMRAFAAS